MSTPEQFDDDEGRWSAVTARVRSADGRFVYAVETTGVFCRPSCASRPARRENVRFFDSPAEASRCGFRACKRCRPDGGDPRDAAVARLVAACRLLEGDEVTRTDEVARAVGLSPFHFQRAFKQQVGVTPQAYRRRVRAERAKAGLIAAPSVTRALVDAGYSSPSRFYEETAAELGMAPARARAGGRGEDVQYAVRACPVGTLLIAWTPRGACDVRLGAGEGEVTEALRGRFPDARRHVGRAPPWVDAVVESVERPAPHAIPLDIEGTVFQERVWRELRRIPFGETRSYAEVAAAIGAPGAARAVAGACAKNSLALIVPCHRVVREDGSLSGYRWGKERKRALLDLEARAVAARDDERDG